MTRERLTVDGVIAAFREAESGTALGAVISDRQATAVLSAWPLVARPWRRPTGYPPADPLGRWEWLWSSAEVPMADLREATGLTPLDTARAWQMVRRCRLVYPDGSISEPARRLLIALVPPRED